MIYSTRSRTSSRGLRQAVSALIIGTVIGLASAWAEPKPVATRAFSPSYKKAKILQVMAVIRPDLGSVVFGTVQPQPGLPDVIVVTDCELVKAGYIGQDLDGRTWVIERPSR